MRIGLLVDEGSGEGGRREGEVGKGERKGGGVPGIINTPLSRSYQGFHNIVMLIMDTSQSGGLVKVKAGGGGRQRGKHRRDHISSTGDWAAMTGALEGSSHLV